MHPGNAGDHVHDDHRSWLPRQRNVGEHIGAGFGIEPVVGFLEFGDRCGAAFDDREGCEGMIRAAGHVVDHRPAVGESAEIDTAVVHVQSGGFELIHQCEQECGVIDVRLGEVRVLGREPFVGMDACGGFREGDDPAVGVRNAQDLLLGGRELHDGLSVAGQQQHERPVG